MLCWSVRNGGSCSLHDGCELQGICENTYLLIDSRYCQGTGSIQLEQGGGGNCQEKSLKIKGSLLVME